MKRTLDDHLGGHGIAELLTSYTMALRNSTGERNRSIRFARRHR